MLEGAAPKFLTQRPTPTGRPAVVLTASLNARNARLPILRKCQRTNRLRSLCSSHKRIDPQADPDLPFELKFNSAFFEHALNIS